MDNFNEIYATLSTVPGLCDSIGMEKAMAFVRLAGRLKDTITTAQPPSHDAAEAPQELPDGIRTFLSSAVDLPTEYIDGCWKAFGDLIWTYDEDGKTKGSDAEAFKKYGLAVASRMQGGLAHTRFDTSPVVEGGARGGCGGGGGGGGEGGSGGGWLRSGSMAGGGGGGGERRSSLRGNGSFAPKVCPGLRAYGSEDGGGCQPRKPQQRHCS
ncbi:hypothetical protein FB451DRAFT_75782, partial [Mycena latifolia]